MNKTPEPWTEAELRDQFACYEDKDHPWTLDRYNQYGEYFDRAIAKIKADAWEEGWKQGYSAVNPYKEEQA